jgi:hypothetical protein
VGEGPETWCCWFGFYARHCRTTTSISGEAAIEAAGRPAAAGLREGEEVFEQYVRDIITKYL